LRVEDGHVVVALADPEDLGAIDDLQALLGKPLHEGVALASDIRLFLQAHCRLDNADDIVADMLGQEPGGEGEPAMRMTTRSEAIKPVPQLLDRLLQDAVRRQALHFFLIPFGEEEVRVRMCLPGKILETDSYATRLHGNLINRLRVLCDLVGKDKRQPQNGAFLKVIDGEKHRFDVMIVPAETGDAVTVFIDQQPDEEVQEQPRCPGCDAHVKKGWTFCPACGAQL
jgi:type IV pilus assembly protein PilB